MQGAVDRMSKACDNFQLTITTKKTEVVQQPAPGKAYSEPTITVNGQKLQVVDKFIYLGSTLSTHLLRVPTHIEQNKKVYFFIKRLRHTDAHFFS